MRRSLGAALVLTTAIILAGCAGRDPVPVAVQQSYDKDMDCDDISFEIENNNKRIRATVKELEDTKGDNVAWGVVGVVLFWPALFAMDLSDAEEVEIRALQDRSHNLTRIGHKRDCDEMPAGISSVEVEQELDENRRKPIREPLGAGNRR